MRKWPITLFLILLNSSLFGQNVTITPNGISPAMSGNIPRLTYEQMIQQNNPQVGDLTYDLTFKCLRHYTGNEWLCTHQNSAAEANTKVLGVLSGGGNMEINDMKTNASGDIYIVGYHTAPIFYFDQEISSIYTSNLTAFIAKFNAAGNFVWLKDLVNTSSSYVQFVSLDLDGASNAYVSGGFGGSFNFSGTAYSSNNSSSDFFILKYDSNGNEIWAKPFGGTGADLPGKLRVDANGNVISTGRFESFINFQGTYLTSPDTDSFLLKLNSAGNVQWVKNVVCNGSERINDIEFDNNNNIYLVGKFSKSIAFGSLSASSNTNFLDIFFTKYLANGTADFLKTSGGTGDDIATSVSFDGTHFYISGEFNSSSISFNPNNNVSIVNSSSGGYNDVFIVKSSITGNFVWGVSHGKSAVSEYASALTAKAADGVTFLSTFDFETTVESEPITSKGSRDILLTKYNEAGELIKYKAYGGSFSDEQGIITTSTTGNTYVLGKFQSRVNFGGQVVKKNGFYFCIFLFN